MTECQSKWEETVERVRMCWVTQYTTKTLMYGQRYFITSTTLTTPQTHQDGALELVELPAVVPGVHPGAATPDFAPFLVDCGLHGPFGVARVLHQVSGRAPLVLAAQHVRL